MHTRPDSALISALPAKHIPYKWALHRKLPGAREQSFIKLGPIWQTSWVWPMYNSFPSCVVVFLDLPKKPKRKKTCKRAKLESDHQRPISDSMEIKIPLKGHKLLHFPVFKVESRNPSPDLFSLLIYLLLLLEPWKSESLPNSISFPLKTLPNISFSFSFLFFFFLSKPRLHLRQSCYFSQSQNSLRWSCK